MVAEDTQIGEDDGEGRFQLVAGVGDELALLRPGFFDRAEDPAGQPPDEEEKGEPRCHKAKQTPEQQAADVGGFVAAIDKGDLGALRGLAHAVGEVVFGEGAFAFGGTEHGAHELLHGGVGGVHVAREDDLGVGAVFTQSDDNARQGEGGLLVFGVKAGAGARRRIRLWHGVAGIGIFHSQRLIVGAVGVLKALGARIVGGEGVDRIGEIDEAVQRFKGDVFVMLHISGDDDQHDKQEHHADGRHDDDDETPAQRGEPVHDAVSSMR